jgi:hypothetical protein
MCTARPTALESNSSTYVAIRDPARTVAPFVPLGTSTPPSLVPAERVPARTARLCRRSNANALMSQAIGCQVGTITRSGQSAFAHGLDCRPKPFSCWVVLPGRGTWVSAHDMRISERSQRRAPTLVAWLSFVAVDFSTPGLPGPGGVLGV